MEQGSVDSKEEKEDDERSHALIMLTSGSV